MQIIEVPSGPELYDIYDDLLLHFRRYKMRILRELFLEAGFSILRQSHLGFFLYPGFYLVKRSRRKMRSEISESEIEELVSQNIDQTGDNPFFHGLMGFELTLGKRITYPVGIRCLITAQNPPI